MAQPTRYEIEMLAIAMFNSANGRRDWLSLSEDVRNDWRRHAMRVVKEQIPGFK
jgi:hypothetical protein